MRLPFDLAKYSSNVYRLLATSASCIPLASDVSIPSVAFGMDAIDGSKYIHCDDMDTR